MYYMDCEKSPVHRTYKAVKVSETITLGEQCYYNE